MKGLVEDFVETVTRGNVVEVKVVLASVVAALAVYQVLLMAVGYGRLRPPFLDAGPASSAHRAIGDSIVVITVIVAVMCLSYAGLGDEGGAHAPIAIALLATLAVKVAVVRLWHGMSRLLPLLGISVLVLFVATWVSAAAEHVVG